MLYKQSKQRDLIYNYMKDLHQHVSAETLHKTLNSGNSNVSLATVYRNLNILEEQKKIRKLALPTQGYVYDGNYEPHYHFYCSECSTLYDIDHNYDENVNELFKTSVDGTIVNHSLTFSGICNNCRNKH
ncbi:MAG: transcriptional repressor [Erysipelotrichaceae bacterium]